MNLNTTGVKLVMVGLHVAGLVAGILLGQWVFDAVAY